MNEEGGYCCQQLVTPDNQIESQAVDLSVLVTQTAFHKNSQEFLTSSCPARAAGDQICSDAVQTHGSPKILIQDIYFGQIKMQTTPQCQDLGFLQQVVSSQ